MVARPSRRSQIDSPAVLAACPSSRVKLVKRVEHVKHRRMAAVCVALHSTS